MLNYVGYHYICVKNKNQIVSINRYKQYYLKIKYIFTKIICKINKNSIKLKFKNILR